MNYNLKNLFRGSLLVILTSVALSACVQPVPGPGPSGKVWVPGHYNRNQAWVPGHFMPRNAGPGYRAGAAWVPGHYNRWGGWVPGGWR